MGVLDPEYTGKSVDTISAFEEEVARKKREKEAGQVTPLKKEESGVDLKELEKETAKKQLNNAANDSEKLKLNKDDKPEDKGSSMNSAKALLAGVNTSSQGMDPGAPPPPAMMSALQAGISSGGNPAAIGGALMMGLIQSAQYKDRAVKMGYARADMEKAKGEQAKGEIALKMGDAVSRAIGGAGRKRSINI